MKKIRIGVPFPHHGKITLYTQRSLTKIKMLGQQGKLPFDVDIYEVNTSYISKGRNVLINPDHGHYIKQEIDGFDYYLSVDADVEFTPDDLINTFNKIEENQWSVLSGFYPIRNVPDKGCAGNWINEELGYSNLTTAIPFDSIGVKKVGWVGAGFCMIRKDVFEKIDYPWYMEYCTEIDDKCFQSGEDLYFCHKCLKNKIDVYLDCDIKLKHYTEENV